VNDESFSVNDLPSYFHCDILKVKAFFATAPSSVFNIVPDNFSDNHAFPIFHHPLAF